MNRPLLLLFLGASLSAGAFLEMGAGCGGSGGSGGTSSSKSSSSGAGAAGTGGHASSSTHASSTSGGHGGGGTGGTSGSGGAGGTSGTGGTGGTLPMADCTTYCTDIMANCTGADAQFPDMTTCMNVCADYTVGTNEDKDVNTLGCRVVQAAAAAKKKGASCAAAGPTGGDEDPKGTAGTCGEPCDAFCEVALVVCANKPNAYKSMAACLAECQMFPADSAAYSSADTTTDDMGCRFTHLSLAAEGAMQAMSQCALIHFSSAECTM